MAKVKLKKDKRKAQVRKPLKPVVPKEDQAIVRKKKAMRTDLSSKLNKLARIDFKQGMKLEKGQNTKRILGYVLQRVVSTKALDYGGRKLMNYRTFLDLYSKTPFQIRKQILGYAFSTYKSFDDYMGYKHRYKYHLRDTPDGFAIGFINRNRRFIRVEYMNKMNEPNLMRQRDEVYSIKEATVAEYEQQLEMINLIGSNNIKVIEWNILQQLMSGKALFETILRLIRHSLNRIQDPSQLLFSALGTSELIRDGENMQKEHFKKYGEYSTEPPPEVLDEGEVVQFITFRGHLQQMEHYQDTIAEIYTGHSAFVLNLGSTFYEVLVAIKSHVEYMKPRDGQEYEEYKETYDESIETIYTTGKMKAEQVMLAVNDAMDVIEEVYTNRARMKDTVKKAKQGAKSQYVYKTKDGVPTPIPKSENILNAKFMPPVIYEHPEVTPTSLYYHTTHEKIQIAAKLQNYLKKFRRVYD